MNLLGLRLDVHSEPGKGTRFCLDVPSSTARISALAASPVSDTAQHLQYRFLPRVLLIEDDAAVRRATRMFLRAEGYEVITAASGAEAIEQLGQQPHVDILVTDYHLGGETGLEVIAWAREKLGIALPAVLVSGDTSSLIQKLEHDERLRIVSKPIQPEQLLSLISGLLDGCRHEER